MAAQPPEFFSGRCRRGKPRRSAFSAKPFYVRLLDAFNKVKSTRDKQSRRDRLSHAYLLAGVHAAQAGFVWRGDDAERAGFFARGSAIRLGCREPAGQP